MLDLTGDINIDEASLNILSRGPMLARNNTDDPPPRPAGLKKLNVIKFNSLEKMFDNSLINLMKANP